jgi:hypothetical protein
VLSLVGQCSEFSTRTKFRVQCATPGKAIHGPILLVLCPSTELASNLALYEVREESTGGLEADIAALQFVFRNEVHSSMVS